MITEYRCTYHNLLDDVMQLDILNDVAQKLFDVLLSEKAALNIRDMRRLVFEGELADLGKALSRQEQKESICNAIEELWAHAIPVMSYRPGHYVLGDKPSLVSCEITRLEEEIQRLQEWLASMRDSFEQQISYNRRKR